MSETEPLVNVFQPSLGARELAAVERVFASNWTGKGKVTAEFEARFARHVGTGRDLVRSVSCCSEGLFQAVALLGIGPGDEVVLPTISFVAMGNAIAAHGATPVFCDVDPRTLNATAGTIEEKLSNRTKAVAVLHYGGAPCAIDEIHDLVSPQGIALIEDSACSVASTYRGRACGTFGDIGVWSFDSMKILVTGDGGMMYLRDVELAQRAEQALYLGLTTASGLQSTATDRWWEFELSGFARRAIMNDIASAIGLEQLDRLSGFIEHRREIHERYDRAFEDIGDLATPPPLVRGATSSYYLYWLQTSPERRDPLARFLRERSIYTTFRYHPLHLVEHYCSGASLPFAEHAARSTLCVPIHQSMTDDDVARVIDVVCRFFDRR